MPRAPAALASQVRALTAALAPHADAGRAAGAQRYLKSSLRFLGVTVPVVRKTAAQWVREHPELDAAGALVLAEALWRTDVHELRSLGIAILERVRAQLTAAEVPGLIALVRDADTWAHVDWLATKVLGPLAVQSASGRKQLALWSRDANFWVRRTALLAWHDALLAGGGDFEHFAQLARPLLADREFFIRKAIGWVLRSTSRRTPERTIGFVRAHAKELSALSFREAVRNLPAKQIAQLTALRQG
jgi:3-methyladenine DNA glycosylase AlkD